MSPMRSYKTTDQGLPEINMDSKRVAWRKEKEKYMLDHPLEVRRKSNVMAKLLQTTNLKIIILQGSISTTSQKLDLGPRPQDLYPQQRR